MKKQLIISSIIVLTIGTAWFMLLISPLIHKKEMLNTSLIEAEANLSNFRKILIEFPQEFNAGRDLLDRKKQWIAELYSKEDLIKLFEEMKGKAAVYNLHLAEITPSIEELLALNKLFANSNQAQILNIVIRMDGGYRNLGEFVRAMEAQKFYQGINFCKINAAPTDQAYPEMTFGFKAILGTIKDI